MVLVSLYFLIAAINNTIICDKYKIGTDGMVTEKMADK